MKNIFLAKNGNENKEVIITTAMRPKFSSAFGRTWDMVRVSLDGVEIKAYLDTSRGMWIYLFIKDKWYKLKLFSDYADVKYDYSILCDIDHEIKLITISK